MPAASFNSEVNSKLPFSRTDKPALSMLFSICIFIKRSFKEYTFKTIKETGFADY
jgi:hypothetical protein